jgi:hypothetical protein
LEIHFAKTDILRIERMMIMKDKKVTDIKILCKAPLSNCVPDDVRRWLDEQKQTDLAIAEAMAMVGRKSGWLHHELNDPDNDAESIVRYKKEYNGWWKLEKELKDEILMRLERQNIEQGTAYKTTGKGWHYLIEPFMNQNGYRDDAGWWIKKSEE